MEGLVLDRALATDGQMSRDELAWLADRAREHRRIIELGSYRGRSTRALADNTSGIVLAVDDWYGPRETTLDKHERATVADDFRRNLADHLASRRVQMVTWDHNQLDAMTLDGPPDMVFVDGDHSYPSTAYQCRWAIRQFPDGGFLCGHDVDRVEVQRAVDDVLGPHGGWFAGPGTLWWARLVMQYGARPRG
jgi:predicted O-methyltransferase YrrM